MHVRQCSRNAEVIIAIQAKTLVFKISLKVPAEV